MCVLLFACVSAHTPAGISFGKMDGRMPAGYNCYQPLKDSGCLRPLQMCRAFPLHWCPSADLEGVWHGCCVCLPVAPLACRGSLSSGQGCWAMIVLVCVNNVVVFAWRQERERDVWTGPSQPITQVFSRLLVTDRQAFGNFLALSLTSVSITQSCSCFSSPHLSASPEHLTLT